MRAASSALQTFLASRQPFWSADLFTITLASGTVYRWASTDQPVTYGGNTWLPPSASTPGLTRGAWAVKNTIEVPTLEISLISSGLDFASGGNIKLDLHNGLFDGAWIELDRAFMPIIGDNFGDTSLGTVAIFAGRVGEIQINATGAKIKVRGANVLMDQYMPKNRYMLGCIHRLYDVNCTVNRAAHTFSATVASATASSVQWTSDPTSGGYANLQFGALAMTSGAANGSLRTIQYVNSGGVSLMYPLYQVPAPGDTFTVTYGCDKTLATCNSRFSNTQHYRGFPYVPPAETAVIG